MQHWEGIFLLKSNRKHFLITRDLKDEKEARLP